MEAFLISVGVIAFLVLIGGIKVVREYERGVIFRLGRLVGARGPGIFYVWPIIEQMVKVELRIVTLDIPRQEVITRDNVTISVNAVLYFRVYNPEDAIVQIQDFLRATSQIAQTTMRAVVGQSELDEMLAERDKINNTLQEIIDAHTDPWGIKVTAVEIKDVDANAQYPVDVVMTLTTPMCPVAETLPPEVEAKVRSVEGVGEVHLDLVWDPPWSPDMMSEVAKLALNM